ncbi:MAG: GNAT family protein [Bacteroidia bacterium]
MIPTDLILKTPRYLLRIPNESDIDFVFSASRYPGFNDGMQWDPPEHKDTIAESLKRSIQSWKEGKGYSFTIVSRDESAQRLGRISIRPDQGENVWNIGYWTHPEHQKKGIMTEAVGAILEFGFTQLQATKITACTATWNKASEKVLLNHGFTFVRFIEQGFQKKGEWVSENEYELNMEDWNPNFSS